MQNLQFESVGVNLQSIHFDLCVDATGVVCHQLGLLSTDLTCTSVSLMHVEESLQHLTGT